MKLTEREQEVLTILIIVLLFSIAIWLGGDYHPLADRITEQLEEIINNGVANENCIN